MHLGVFMISGAHFPLARYGHMVTPCCQRNYSVIPFVILEMVIFILKGKGKTRFWVQLAVLASERVSGETRICAQVRGVLPV